MSTSDTEAVSRHEIEEMWNSSGDLDAMNEYVAEDIDYHAPRMDLHGMDEYRKAAEEARTVLSDFETTVEDVIASDDKVAIRYTMRGTHSGEAMGIEPTNEQIEMTGMFFDRIEDGKIRERYESPDELGMLTQMGAVEPPEVDESEL